MHFLDGDLSFIAYNLEDPANAGTYLDIAEYWQANAQLYGNYAHALMLLDPQTQASITQVNVPMHPDLPPTDGWFPRFIYKKNVHIPLADIPPGTYLLALQAWEEPTADPKLTISETDQELITPDIVVLGEIVIP